MSIPNESHEELTENEFNCAAVSLNTYLANHPYITRKQLCVLTGISDEQARRLLRRFVHFRSLEKIKTGDDVRYVLRKSDK